MALLITLGLIGIGTVIGTSAFLFRRHSKNELRQNGGTKEVVTYTLRSLNDVDMLCETIDKGNMIILGVKDFARLDMIRLKRTVHQLKSHVLSRGGDIIALGKDFVVLVPSTMKLSQITNYLQKSEAENMDLPPKPPTEVGTI
ncbi:MAG TPA: cell division protein SepF [Candidatus Bathyarchaeia archaeon]|nr:cell division protein SepF [Candidatus Bathyarchaeia archaeon]